MTATEATTQPPANDPLILTPAEAVLTAGQQVRFTLSGAPAADTVTWSISPDLAGAFHDGVLVAPVRIDAPSIHTVQATTPDGRTATAMCRLAAISVTLLPPKVELHLEEQQQFTALTSGDPSNGVIWTITPTVGSLTNGLYGAPHSLGPTEIVQVTVTSKLDPAQSATAEVKLLKPKLMPPQERVGFGIGLVVFGFILCGLVIAYWPLSDPDPAASKAADDAAKSLQARQTQTAKAQQDVLTAMQAQAANSTKGAADPAKILADAAKSQADKALDTAKAEQSNAEKQAKETADALKPATVNIIGIQFPVQGGPLVLSMPRELNFLVLALIMGALGSFIHTAKSFTGFAGNRTLVASWAWWYVLHPLIGMTLALIFYVVVRGGFFATGAGPGAVNPYGIAAVCGLVGMFSKQATDKLGELFNTLFKTAADPQSKDKMTSQPAAPPAPINHQP